MPVETQVVSLALNKGINTKVDPKQVMIGELLTLENGTFISPQQIKKRSGYTPITQDIVPTGSISSGNSIANFNGSLIELDNQYLYSYSENEGGWINKGYKPCFSITTSPIGINAISQSSPKVALHPSGVALITWDNGPAGGFYISYFDTTTSANIFTMVYGIYSTNTLVFVYGNTFYVIAENQPSNVAELIAFSVTNPGFSGGASTLLSLNTTYYQGNVCGLQLTNNPYVIYVNPSSDLIINEYDTTFTVLVNSVIVAIASAANVILCSNIIYDSYNNYIWALWYENINGTEDPGSGIYVSIYDLSLNLISGPNLVDTSQALEINSITAVILDSQNAVIYGERSASSVSPFFGQSVENIIFRFQYNWSTQATVFTRLLYTCTLTGNAFTDSNNNVYIPVAFKTPDESTNFILRDLNPYTTSNNFTISVVCKYAPLSASQSIETLGTNSANLPLFSVIPTLSGGLYIAYVTEVDTTINLGVVTGKYNVNLLELNFNTKQESISLGDNLNTTGGIVTVYDGAGIAESGFNVFPIITVLGYSTTPLPNNIGAGTYSYQLLYEWIDNFGNIHRSAPSPAMTITIAQSSRIDITTFYLFLTEPYKGPNVTISAYRTTNGGTIYYKSATTTNTVSSISLEFVDNTPDSVLVGNEQLYTNGGEVDNISPPSSMTITSFKNRIILIPSESTYSWWYSKQVIPGFPVEFSDLFVQNIDQKGGPIFNVSTMDDKLIFFKQYLIFYVIGDGPAPSGANNDFSYPQVISTDVGCADNIQPVILTPAGIIFKSTKGIYLLDRSLQTSYIGAPVEKYNSFAITSATLTPNTTQVRFTLSNGIALVYDYYISRWSIFTNISAVDAVIYKNVYSYLNSSGLIFEEDPTNFTDNGTSIVLKLITGYLSFAQIQGFERVKKLLILGDNNTANTLNVSFSYNFIPTQYPINQITLPISSVQPFKERIFLPFQKCQTVQVEIYDAPIGTPTGTFDISNLAFEVGIKKGPAKLPAAQSNG